MQQRPAHLQSPLGMGWGGVVWCGAAASLVPVSLTGKGGASALRRFQEKKDRNIVRSGKAGKWTGRHGVWIEGAVREMAGGSGGLSDCRSYSRGRRREGRRHRSAGEIKINDAWQISWSVIFTWWPHSKGRRKNKRKASPPPTSLPRLHRLLSAPLAFFSFLFLPNDWAVGRRYEAPPPLSLHHKHMKRRERETRLSGKC